MEVWTLALLSSRIWSLETSTVCIILLDHKIPLPTHLWWYELGTCGCLGIIRNYQGDSSCLVRPTLVAGCHPFCTNVQLSTIEVECCYLEKMGTHSYISSKIDRCRPKYSGLNYSISFILVSYQLLWRWHPLPSRLECRSLFLYPEGIPSFLKGMRRMR